MSFDLNLCNALFNQDKLDVLFPPERTNKFFEALFGDMDEGAYDIRLAFDTLADSQLFFNFELHQRPGRCLACNLTYGLPQVFERHPVIDVKGVVDQIDRLLDGESKCGDWRLGKSKEISRSLHVVPLVIDMV